MVDLTGKTLPLDYFSLDADTQNKLFGSIGQAAIELHDVAHALETQNDEWFRNCQSLVTYYKTLSQNLIATQQALFGRNVTGNDKVSFSD